MLGTGGCLCCWGESARVWMTRGRVVWFVCSGWGTAAVVDRLGSRGKSVRSLPTAVSTADGVTGGVAEAKVFSCSDDGQRLER